MRKLTVFQLELLRKAAKAEGHLCNQCRDTPLGYEREFVGLVQRGLLTEDKGFHRLTGAGLEVASDPLQFGRQS